MAGQLGDSLTWSSLCTLKKQSVVVSHADKVSAPSHDEERVVAALPYK
jgi:hypothetical protein